MSPLSLLWLAFSVFVLAAATADAADLAGSKDPEGFGRFERSEIIHYSTSSTDEYFLARDQGAVGLGFKKEERVEGSTLRVVYKVPLGATALEVFHFYEQLLSRLGFEETFKLGTGTLYPLSAKDFHQRFFFQADYATRKGQENTPFQDAKNQYYLTARLVRDGQAVNVAVLVAESDGLEWQESSVKQPIVIRLGQPVVGVDIISSKQNNYQTVVIKANDMAKALTNAGKIDVYGIFFDIDKTDLKPESRVALDEVAKLLKSDPSLKIEVAGHTDNRGGAEHNMKLSVGRATAVVNALVDTYGIDRGRLQPNGYGETKPAATNDSDQGRARNRRVELRKL